MKDIIVAAVPTIMLDHNEKRETKSSRMQNAKIAQHPIINKANTPINSFCLFFIQLTSTSNITIK